MKFFKHFHFEDQRYLRRIACSFLIKLIAIVVEEFEILLVLLKTTLRLGKDLKILHFVSHVASVIKHWETEHCWEGEESNYFNYLRTQQSAEKSYLCSSIQLFSRIRVDVHRKLTRTCCAIFYRKMPWFRKLNRHLRFTNHYYRSNECN